MAPAIAGSLASTIYTILLSRICVLLIVCVFVVGWRCVGRQLMWLLAVMCVCGRKWRRRVLGFHSRRIGVSLSLEVHRQYEASPEDMQSRRGVGHVIAGVEACLRRGKTLVTYNLRSQGLGRRSWAWPLPSCERAKARHRLGAK